MKNKNATCNKCGWVYFVVSREYIENWKKDWEVFWPTLDAQGKENYGLPNGPPTDKQYLKCWCGNSYKNFRDSKPEDCPNGCTISPILDRDEL